MVPIGRWPRPAPCAAESYGALDDAARLLALPADVANSVAQETAGGSPSRSVSPGPAGTGLPLVIVIILIAGGDDVEGEAMSRFM